MRTFLQRIVDGPGLASQRGKDAGFESDFLHYRQAKAKGWIIDAVKPHKSSEDGSGVDIFIVKSLSDSGRAELRRLTANVITRT